MLLAMLESAEREKRPVYDEPMHSLLTGVCIYTTITCIRDDGWVRGILS
jgi:hypothetical protein